MASIHKPPTPLHAIATQRSVFLAGSIEMGEAEDWQARVSRELDADELVILNPRRDEWDATWEQSIDNPLFREQVEWELTALELSTMIVMYFAPGSKSPITLLELGLFASTGKLVVCCPDGFWRKGNVDIVCGRYNVPQVAAIDELTAEIRSRLGR